MLPEGGAMCACPMGREGEFCERGVLGLGRAGAADVLSLHDEEFDAEAALPLLPHHSLICAQ